MIEIFSDGKPLPMTLIENKADLLPENERNNTSDLKEFAKSNNFIAGYKTSAKTGLNINESMDFLVKNVIKRLSQIHSDIKKVETLENLISSELDEETRTKIQDSMVELNKIFNVEEGQ